MATTTKTNKAATRSVIRNLLKDYVTPLGRSGTTIGEAWEFMGRESADAFARDARAYLGDHSELRGSTLGAADWQAVYEEFFPQAAAQVVATNATIGYGRVSTKDQDTKLQRDALNEAGCIRIFEEKRSGKTTAGREALAAALDYAREGDTVCVWRLDRLGRSTLDILRIAEDLHARGISLRILTGTLAGSYSPRGEGKFFFTIMAAFAELERDIIIERTRAGLETARAQGRVGGRPTVMDPDKLAAARARRDRGESVTGIAKALGVSRATLYRALADAESDPAPIG